MKTKQEIIKEACDSLIIISTMLTVICDAVGIDPDDTKMKLCADEEVLKSITITEGLERAKNAVEELKKVGF